MEKHPATIKDVASYCGLSVATVSRVLNNIPSVKPSSRERVLSAMRALNYVPNRLAASLKSNLSHTIGLISIDISNPAQMTIAREIESYVSQYGYMLFIVNSEDDEQKERAAIQTLNEYMVDGIMLTATGKNNDLLASIQNNGRPVIILDRRPHGNTLNFVGADKCTGCYEATSLLAKKGYRHIALVNGPHDIATSYDRFNGFVRALYDAHLPVINESIFHGSFSPEYAQMCFRTLWEREQRPDAIISGGEMITVGILEAARSMHVRIPEDVGFLSFGNLAHPNLIEPKLTYLESFPNVVGRKAAELMISLLKEPSSTPQQIIVSTELVQGNSLI